MTISLPLKMDPRYAAFRLFRSSIRWSMLVKHLRPPLNGMPLDRYTWEWFQKLYPGETHQIITPAGKELSSPHHSQIAMSVASV
jgi:hypothetical protein